MLGELTYEKWFSFDSTIILAEKSRFDIKPKGFWGTTVEVTQDAVTLLHFQMSWNGNIIIHTMINNQQQDFVFKQEGFLKNQYVLTDSEHQQVLVAQPDFKWKELSYSYAMSTTDFFETLSFGELLLLLTVHCANYYITMMSTSVVLASI